MNIIETRQLTKYYGKHLGIKGIDLEIEKGDFFGFIGPNGAGKSTTIRTLLGMIHATSGEAKLFGENIGHPALLSRIGYMASEAIFYDNMQVKDVIKYSASLHKKNCDNEAAKLCDRLQLDTSKKISELSLGNRKKVAIVCAMQHQPELYIFDEPTSGLDPLMQREFFDLLKEKHAAGATIFLSSHVLTEIQKNCNRAAIIKDGEIVVCDSVENLSRTNARRITLTGVNAVPEGLDVKSVIQGADSVSFLYTGDVKALLSSLVTLQINDLTITEPELDEIFMHYYQE